jgi:hypothetical protein
MNERRLDIIMERCQRIEAQQKKQTSDIAKIKEYQFRISAEIQALQKRLDISLNQNIEPNKTLEFLAKAKA